MRSNVIIHANHVWAYNPRWLFLAHLKLDWGLNSGITRMELTGCEQRLEALLATASSGPGDIFSDPLCMLVRRTQAGN